MCLRKYESKSCYDLTGGNIISAARMGNTQNGKRSTRKLVEFKEEELPKKLALGYMMYSVRPYVRAPCGALTAKDMAM